MKQINKHAIRVNDSKRFINYIVLVLLAISQSSCFQHFYQTNSAAKVDSSVLKGFDDEKKYFIVHTPTEVFALNNVKVDSEMISGDRELLNKKYDKYRIPNADEGNQFQKKDAGIVFSQVHLYTQDSVEKNGHIQLAIHHIYQADAYGSDKKADKKSRTTSIIGLSLIPVAVIGAFVIAASVSSVSSSIVHIIL